MKTEQCNWDPVKRNVSLLGSIVICKGVWTLAFALLPVLMGASFEDPWMIYTVFQIALGSVLIASGIGLRRSRYASLILSILFLAAGVGISLAVHHEHPEHFDILGLVIASYLTTFLFRKSYRVAFARERAA